MCIPEDVAMDTLDVQTLSSVFTVVFSLCFLPKKVLEKTLLPPG
jgi:hypothetical protein